MQPSRHNHKYWHAVKALFGNPKIWHNEIKASFQSKEDPGVATRVDGLATEAGKFIKELEPLIVSNPYKGIWHFSCLYGLLTEQYEDGHCYRMYLSVPTTKSVDDILANLKLFGELTISHIALMDLQKDEQPSNNHETTKPSK